MIRASEALRKKKQREREGQHREQLIEAAVKLLRDRLSDDELRQLTDALFEAAPYALRTRLAEVVDSIEEEPPPDMQEKIEQMRRSYRPGSAAGGFNVLLKGQ